MLSEDRDKGFMMNTGLQVNFNDRVDDSLPHVDLLEKAGSFIENLTFDMYEYTRHCNNRGVRFGARPRAMAENSPFLDHLFNHCKDLKKLNLISGLYHKCGGNKKNGAYMIKNESITDLLIDGATLSEPLFLELSSRLPALKSLTLFSCYLVKYIEGENTKAFVVDNRSVIDMPYTSFDNLVIANGFVYEDFYIRLLIGEKGGSEFHYLCYDKSAFVCVGEDTDLFRDVPPDNWGWRLLTIRCHSIKRLE